MKDKDVIKLVDEILKGRGAYGHIGNGQKTVTTAGTPEQISTQDIPCQGVYLQPLSGNTGLVYWGSDEENVSSSRGVELIAPVWIPIDNLNKIWLDVATGGEGVCWAIMR